MNIEFEKDNLSPEEKLVMQEMTKFLASFMLAKAVQGAGVLTAIYPKAKQ